MTLQEQINEITQGRTMNQLKVEDRKSYYKVKSLKEKLSWEKSEEKGQFITKEHLSEYRNLIIWTLKNRVNFNGYLNLKDTMISILNRIENENIVYRTTKGIKGIVVSMSVSEGLKNVEENLRSSNGIDWTVGETRSPIIRSFVQHKLNVLS